MNALMKVPIKTKTSSNPPYTISLKGLIQRKCTDGEYPEYSKKRLQQFFNESTGLSNVPPIVHDVLRSPEQQLDTVTYSFIEASLGYNVGGVRTGVGAKVVETVRTVQKEGTVPTGKEEKLFNKLSVPPKQAEKPSAPQAGKVSESLPPVEEETSKESAAETAEEKEIPSEPASPEKAPTSAKEDLAHQAVVRKLKIKAKHQKTPSKKPEQKQEETILAANLTPDKIDTQNAFDSHLHDLKEAQPELTVEGFMNEFKNITKKLAEKLPKNEEDQKSFSKIHELFNRRQIAKQELTNQTHSGPLQKKVNEPLDNYRNKKNLDSKTYELKLDPEGSIPKIKHAKTAAPKPKTEDEISLDDKSRDLDNALLNHDVNGQTINIDEGSLAFPISGEKSFDEAGKAKRKAQDEIEKARPRYREEEGGVISKSQDDIPSLVKTGLKHYNLSRSDSFKEVLSAQDTHKGKIIGVKNKFFNELEKIYNDTKNNVAIELEKLKNIDATFECILRVTQEDFDKSVKKSIDYIYTLGHWGFDYSDWLDKHTKEIRQEYNNQMLKNYAVAVRTVQDRSAESRFNDHKNTFIYDVNIFIQRKIAPKVVKVLNAARKHINNGLIQVIKAYMLLSPDEKTEAEIVLEAVKGQFKLLEESVEDRKSEIIGDMARTYNKSVGKLKARFDEIKKDALTVWWKKAWNKIKAVVNAIIDFARRIAELLRDMAHLVGRIISSPRYFFKNLVNGIGQSFSTFVEGIDTFLADAFFKWLSGSSGLTIQIPKDWGPKGIFSLFTQLLRLSTETIWERMEVVYDKTIANVFRRGEVLLDKGLEIFSIIKNKGIGGLWDHIKVSLGNILEETLVMIKENVLYAAIKKVIFEIGKMLVPGGGFIAIAEKVIRLLLFIVEARDQILDLIKSFVDSVEMAVKGNVPGIIQRITGALTKFITVALDFLVTFFGLRGLKKKVERFIERMRKPIIRGIDWVLGKAKPFVMKAIKKGRELVEKGKEKGTAVGKAAIGAIKSWLGLEETFEASDGKQHKLYFTGKETSPVLMVKSNPGTFSAFISGIDVGTDQDKIKAQKEAKKIAKKIDEKKLEKLGGVTKEDKKKNKETKLKKVREFLGDLAKPTAILFGYDPGAAGEPEITHDTQSKGYGITMTAKKLNKEQERKGSRPTTKWKDSYAILNERRHEGNPKESYYVKGHLLNEKLGGKGDWENLTPLSIKGNSAHEREVESKVKAGFESGAVIEYNVTAEYGWGKNADKIPAEDPQAGKKKEIIKQEVNVPTKLTCEAYVLENENGKWDKKQTIVDKPVTNPIGQEAGNYVLGVSPPRMTIYLNKATAEKISTIEGIDSNISSKIFEAHKIKKSRFNSYDELSKAPKNDAKDLIFPKDTERDKIKKLSDVKYVKLYKGIAAG